jgi:HK97 family phage portal protein
MNFDLGQALRSQKALGPHPALMDRSVPVSVYSPGASRQDAKLTQREAAQHLDAYGGRQAIDHVMNAVDLYATTSAGAAWRLQKPDGTRLVKKKTRNDGDEVEVGPEDLYELLTKPNPFMLYDELVQLLIIDLLLVGNGYWFKWRTNEKGQPIALYRLSPQHVKIIPGEYGPKGYEYQPPGARDPLVIALPDIVHFKLPNPHSAYYGKGIISKGGRVLDLELAVVDTMSSYYENRADPSMIISSERRLPRDVYNKLRAQLRARLSGSSRAGELLVLEAGLKAETLDRNARDSLFKEISGLSAARIYAMFRTSPRLFGIATDESGTDKVSDARREFDTYVMRPFLTRLQDNITEHLVTAWDLEFKIDYNYAIPQDELLKNISTVAAVPGIKVRELRRALLPLGFLDGESTGDPEIDDEILNMPMEEMDATGQGGAADRPLAGEAGRPPKGENTSNFKRTRTPSKKALDERTEEQKALAAAENLTKALQTVAAGEKAVKFEPEHSNTSVGYKLDAEKRPQDPQSATRTRTVDDNVKYIMEGLADATTTLERSLLDHVEGKAFSKKDVVSRMNKSEAWVTFREKVEAVLMEAARRGISGAVMDQAAEGRIADEDLDYDAIAAEVVHRKHGLPSIVRTLKKRLLAKIQNLPEDADREAANAVVRGHLSEWNVGHAETIALAEAVEGYNEGTLSVAEATGATEVFVVEEDDAPDQPCIDARHSVWSIDYARDHRKEHPRCRRAFIPLTV